MIKIENTEVIGWEHAIRGMRNPMNSWDKSDSHECEGSCDYCEFWRLDERCNHKKDDFIIGPNDLALMKKLAKAGTDHRKFMRMIVVYLDITAPLYWWKEFDTYKVGTVANSCSTMHKIHAKEFMLDDFSCEHLMSDDYQESPDTPLTGWDDASHMIAPKEGLEIIIELLNASRELYLKTKDKKYWWQMIQLLPSSYNQKRTVMLNYEVLANMYTRKNHKLDEWHVFCDWIEQLPYSELITGKE